MKKAKSICYAENCDREGVSFGLCDRHYRRLKKFGDANYNPRPMTYGDEIERFHQKYIPEPNSGCWIWLGGTRANSGGLLYARHSRNDGSSINGHRFAWEIHHGKIPESLNVCHHCDNTLCVNPDHLFIGTQKDNMQDCVAKGRTNKRRGEEKGTLAKLTNEQAEAIRNSWKSQSELAREFGVTQPTISRIKNGHSY